MIRVLKNLHVLILDVLVAALTLFILSIAWVLYALTCTLTLFLLIRPLRKSWDSVSDKIIFTGLDMEESLGKLIID
jgi:hypothetical protein